MADRDFLAKMVEFDPKRFTFTFQLCFADEASFLQLYDTFFDEEVRTFKFKDKPKKINPATDKQIRFWFACVRQILLHYEIEPDKENMNTLHIQLKKKYLPATFIDVGLIKMPLIPSITEMSIADMAHALDNIITDYLQLGLDLQKYRLRV
jgi:hypothetical protein